MAEKRADKPKRKRKRVASSEAAQKDALSSDERSCSETCEEELFTFKNKKSSLEALEEETLKQVQEELYNDCRYEDIGDERDRSKWKSKADFRAWNVLDKACNDTNGRQQKQQKGKAQTAQQQDDSDDDDDIAADYHCVPDYYYVTPSMPSSQALISNVTRTLHNLRSSKHTPTGANDSIIDCTTPSPSQDANYHITLRIRCKRRVYRYRTLTVKPFSEIVSRLADDLGVVKERILLSYKSESDQSESVPLNATPDSLGLTTVDFLDALVLEKAIADNPVLLPDDDKEQITVRVRSSAKTISYRLGKADPLDKVLAAFSSAVELPQEKIKFEFDGDPVLPDSTAEELGLEDDEIIDARIIND